MVEHEELNRLQIVAFAKETFRCIFIFPPLFVKRCARGIEIAVVHIFEDLIIILE